ncbi:hypothetical protein C8A03DRAFT_32809 [Achaetomium macrosporum]|uniref:Actin-like ATPase domain-containing protein n=1 Tax=Achaetomium macrosporum TaxID=79813 RepID=A0AAN7CBT4_9PEZI|nr:hypothetical protein C8A03DRAFT_32809 [Achaetomium macrosporum]
MREAILKSGILRVDQTMGTRLPASLDFVPEPEAAALGVLPHSDLQPGNVYLIVDCGAGTVDIIPYIVKSSSPLELGDCVAGDGGLLGDMFMKSALVGMLWRQVAAQHNLSDIDKDHLESQMETAWATSRRHSYDDLGSPNWVVRLEVRRRSGARLPDLPICGPDIVREFRSVTDGIVRLVKQQEDAVMEKHGVKPCFIIVVGGFGLNEFLLSELHRCFGSRVVPTGDAGLYAVRDGVAIAGIQRHRGADATAVVYRPDTAALIPVRISTQVSRHSYGYWAGYGAISQLTWFLTKGDDIPVGRPYTIPLNIAAFQQVFGRCYFSVYRCPHPVRGTLPTSAVEDVFEFCHVRCLDPSILTTGLQLQLSTQVTGPAVQFSIFVNGVPVEDSIHKGKFEVVLSDH